MSTHGSTRDTNYLAQSLGAYLVIFSRFLETLSCEVSLERLPAGCSWRLTLVRLSSDSLRGLLTSDDCFGSLPKAEMLTWKLRSTDTTNVPKTLLRRSGRRL